MSDVLQRTARHAMSLPLVLALVAFLPQIAHLRWSADDYAFATLLEPGGGVRVAWDEVLRQGHERWLFSHAYWRPLATLSLALNFQVSGGDPRWFGAVNLLLHLVVVACSTWLCGALVSGPRARVAAVIGGSLVALHPIAVEPVLWISARVSALEVACGSLALVAVVKRARGGGLGTAALGATAFAAALLSKESALAWLVAAGAVDLLDNARRPLWRRIALHAPMVLVALAYLGARMLLLGSVAGSELTPPSLGAILHSAWEKLCVVVAPDAWAGAAWGCLAAALVVTARREVLAACLSIGLLLAWITAVLLPGFAHTLGDDLVGSRLAYGALPALAIAAALVASRARPVVWLAMLAVALHVPATLHATQGYRDAWRTLAVARGELDAHAAEASVERPQCVVAMPLVIPGEIHPLTYAALGEAPFTTAPRPVISLAAPRYAQPFAPSLYGDPHPLFAMLAHGCQVAAWNNAKSSLLLLGKDELACELVRSVGAPRRAVLRFAIALRATSVECVALQAEGDARGGVIRFVTTLGRFGDATDLRFSGGEALAGARRSFLVDLTHHAPLLVAALEDVRIVELEIELDDGASIDSATPLPSLPSLDLARRIAGAELSLKDWASSLRAPASPATRLDLVIVSSAAAHVVPCIAGDNVLIPPPTTATLAEFAFSALRADRLWYWFVARGADPGEPGAARSDVDFVRLLPSPR
ncbi:MAG: hypothetical protein HZB39_20425 [Planctomycetes bacterium]|nr:hypothetical protein [Planctomycetota bacterium]